MISRMWMINGLLTVALVFGGVGVWDVWRQEPVVTSAVVAKGKARPARPFAGPAENAILSKADYQEVVDRNLFSPNRTAPAPPPSPDADDAEPVQEDVRIDGEKVILYGVVVFGDYKAALINNPENRANAPQDKWVREGDRIGNLKVREIREDRVVLADADTSYRVLLYDPDKARKASAVKKSPASSQPKIVSVGEAPAPAKTAVKANTPPKTQSSSVETRSISEDGQYEIIDTPLGQIKRKIK